MLTPAPQAKNLEMGLFVQGQFSPLNLGQSPASHPAAKPQMYQLTNAEDVSRPDDTVTLRRVDDVVTVSSTGGEESATPEHVGM